MFNRNKRLNSRLQLIECSVDDLRELASSLLDRTVTMADQITSLTERIEEIEMHGNLKAKAAASAADALLQQGMPNIPLDPY